MLRLRRRPGDASPEAESLGGQALFLALAGQRAASALHAGEPHVAIVHGNERHILLLAAKTHLVTLLVDGSADLGDVERATRAAFSGR